MTEFRAAALKALFVTFLWSTSWVLIKIGLEEIPALPFAGLRYFIAFGALLLLARRRGGFGEIRKLSSSQWGRLALLGLLIYTITQGTQFLALAYMPAAAVSLLLSFTAVIVAMGGVLLLGEKPAPMQWLGIGIYLAGAGFYFFPITLGEVHWIGWAAAIVSVLANSGSALLGREVNRSGDIDPLLVTVTSMGIGSILLLGLGAGAQGMPHLSWGAWLIILWLAIVNSAWAFTLWNSTLRTLSAVESSVINNTMLVQIAILAWVFLNEILTLRDWVGILLAAAGALIVQLGARRVWND